MISDPNTAKAVLGFLFEASGRLDASVGSARSVCPEAEFVAYRRAVGHVLALMFDEVIRPMLRAHPELSPWGSDPRAFAPNLVGYLDSSGRSASKENGPSRV